MIHQSLHHTQDFLEKKEMSHMYLAVTMVAFGTGLISIFVPIYLYNLGIPVSMIAIYFGLISVYFLLFSYPAAHVVARFGPKHAMLFAIPLFILYYSFLGGLQSVGLPFFLLPAVLALALTLYNFGYHLNYIRHSNKQKRGKELAIFFVLAMVAGALAPFFGSLIAEISFKLLFVVGSIFLFFGILPLLMTGDGHERIDFDLRSVFRRMLDRRGRGSIYSYVGYGIEAYIGRNIWPIFLIIIFVSVSKTGLVVGISTLLSVVVFSFVGKVTDRYSKVKILRLGTVLQFFGWVGRIFAGSPFEVLAVDSFKNTGTKVISVPWWAHSYERAEKENYFLYTVMREVVFNISRALITPVIVLVFVLGYYPFILTFLIAAIAGLAYFLIRD